MFEPLKQIAKNYFPEKSIASNAAKIYFLQFLNIFFGLASGVIIARTLGPIQKGTVDMVNVLSSFVTEIGVLGIGYGFLYYLANKKEPLENIHGSALVFSLVIGVITGALVLIGLPVWRILIPGLKDWMIILPFFISPVTYYVNLWPFIMTGTDRAVTSYKIWLFISICTLIISTILWATGFLNATLMVFVTAVLSLVNALTAFLLIYKQNPKLKFSLQLSKQSLSYGFVVFIGSFANIIHFKIDQIMVNYWLGPEIVGIYALSVYWAEKLFILDGALISSALFKISSSSYKDSFQLTHKVFRAQVIVSSIGGGVLAIMAYPLIFLLYGEAYQEAIFPLIFLIPGIIAWSITKVFSNNLTYNCRNGGFVTRIAVIGSLLNILLNLIGLGLLHLNIIGVAITSSISYIFVAVTIYLKSIRISREQINDLSEK